MTQVLNFAVSDFQVSVGSLDITNALSGFGASHNAAEVGEPLIWSGTLQLTNPLPPYQLAESLDNLINPGRWAKGAHPVKLYINGSLFLTLRILDYSYDPDAQTAEATLTDKLGLVKASGGTKDKPLEGFAPSAQVPLTGKPIINRYSWTDVAKAIATQGSTIRNQTIINPSDVVIPSPNGATYSNPPYVRRDTVAQLANIASASANSWVWCDKNEQIRFVAYPKLGLLPFYRLSRKQVEDFKRLPPDPNDEVTAVEVEGEGTGIMEIPEKELDPNNLAKPINPALNDDENEPPTVDPEDSQFQVLITPGVSYPIVIESPKTGGLMKRQTIFNPLVGGSSVIRREETLGRIDTIIPDSTDTAFIVGEEVYAEEYYSSKEGKLLTRRIVKVEPLGKIAPEVFPKETARITSDDTNEEWYYNLDGTPIERFVTTKKPACVVFKGKKYGTGRIIAQKISETWVKLSGDVTGAKYQHQVLTYKTKGELYPDKYPGDATLVLIPDNPEPEIVDAQPQPIYQETRTPIEIKTPTKEKEFDNAGDTEGTETETTITLTDVPDSGDALDEVAQTAGDIRRQRIGAHEISHPLRSEDLSNYQPFRVVDIHTGRFVRDEFGIALGDDKELSCFYTGNLMGAIAAVPDPPTNLLIQDGGSTTIFVTQGVTISPIKLRSGEGVAPYTYDASGLPDGIALSGNEISGTPTGTGLTSATVTVTDGASNSYSYLLNFNSSIPPVALAHYRQVMRLKGEVQYQGNWSVVESTLTAEIIPTASSVEHQSSWQVETIIEALQAAIICSDSWGFDDTGWSGTTIACSFGAGKLLKATQYQTDFAHPIKVQLSGLSAPAGIQIYKTASTHSPLTPLLFSYVTTLPVAGIFEHVFTSANDMLSFRVKNPASRDFIQEDSSTVTITNFWDTACIQWDAATQTVTLGGF